MYRVEIKPRALKALGRLERTDQERIERAIDGLAEDPRLAGNKKLTNQNMWRIRVGRCRVIYTIHDNRLLVLVVEVGHRPEIYQK